MLLQTYVRVLLRWWWVILLSIGMTLGATALFLSQQPKVYASAATFVVKPRTVNSEELVRAIDTLSRRVEINSTYADISESKLIHNRAADLLDLSDEDRRDVSISSRVVTGTNILRISGEASRPELSREFIGAVSEVTEDYISNLGDVFTLEPLDDPSFSRRPIRPQTRQTMVLAGILGGLLGVGLALGADALARRPDEHLAESDSDDRKLRDPRLRDPRSRALSHRHFRQLADQSALRAHRGGLGFSIAAFGLRTGQLGSDGAGLDAIARNLEPVMRSVDVVADLGDGILAALIPSTGSERSDAIVERYRQKIESIVNGATSVSVAMGSASTPSNGESAPAASEHDVLRPGASAPPTDDDARKDSPDEPATRRKQQDRRSIKSNKAARDPLPAASIKSGQITPGAATSPAEIATERLYIVSVTVDDPASNAGSVEGGEAVAEVVPARPGSREVVVGIATVPGEDNEPTGFVSGSEAITLAEYELMVARHVSSAGVDSPPADEEEPGR